MDKDFYSAEEAMKRLNKTKTIFYELVKNGEIPFEIEPGRKRGKRFPKAAIDVLAETEKNPSEKSTLSFTLQTVAELWEGMEITKTLYNNPEEEVPFKRLVEWRNVNSEIFMSLKEGDKLVGGVTFLPIDDRVANALVNGEIRDKDISPRSIKRWTDSNLSVYIPTIEVLPSGNPHRDKERGMFLLRHTLRWGVILTFQHDIRKWYAVGATEDGRNILEALGFTRVHEDDSRSGYILETKREPVKLIASYVKQIGHEESHEAKVL
jgi:excisionase family DNA binding protein